MAEEKEPPHPRHRPGAFGRILHHTPWTAIALLARVLCQAVIWLLHHHLDLW